MKNFRKLSCFWKFLSPQMDNYFGISGNRSCSLMFNPLVIIKSRGKVSSRPLTSVIYYIMMAAFWKFRCLECKHHLGKKKRFLGYSRILTSLSEIICSSRATGRINLPHVPELLPCDNILEILELE